MAPEVLQALLPQPPDMWSIGVLLYFLLVWTDAFADQSAASSRTNMSGFTEYSFPTTREESCS
jgi:hypothetical protein